MCALIDLGFVRLSWNDNHNHRQRYFFYVYFIFYQIFNSFWGGCRLDGCNLSLGSPKVLSSEYIKCKLVSYFRPLLSLLIGCCWPIRIENQVGSSYLWTPASCREGCEGIFGISQWESECIGDWPIKEHHFMFLLIFGDQARVGRVLKLISICRQPELVTGLFNERKRNNFHGCFHGIWYRGSITSNW